MSILGTCPECLHYADGMCNLRPRICFNYDHFERLPTVTLSRDVFETQYISRATFDAEVARLTAELAAANEDAERPDYNPNGTANPKGNAAYWRARAEAAETKVSEYAKALLLVEMRIISEEAYCAGWMLGLEWACMDIVAGRISNYGLLADFDLHKRTLEELHKFAGGWWMWRDGDQEETFVLDANIVNYKVEGGEE